MKEQQDQSLNYWPDERDTATRLDPSGRLVDYLNPSITRRDTPEERIRQSYVRLLHEDYGYPLDHLALAVAISWGSERREADIVIFKSKSAATSKDQGNIFLIVETKAPNRTEGHNQLVSYIFPTSAEGGVWTNGDSVAYFQRQDRPDQHLTESNGIPSFGETWDGIGLYRKSQLRSPHNLKSAFRKCHNAIYKMGIDSEDVAMDMLRIILAKYQDEQNTGDFCKFRCTPSEYSTIGGRTEVAVRVKELFALVVNANPDVFLATEEITAGDYEIATVVSELQRFRFLSEDIDDDIHDVIGEAYESYVAAHLKGARGQFFTNRMIVNLMVRIVNPSERDNVLDPAVGSGGFLIAVMRHVVRAIERSDRSNTAKRNAKQLVPQHLFGIDKAPKLVKVAKTNMILAGDGHTGITWGDSLAPVVEIDDPQFIIRSGIGMPTVILTNPPFGATAEHKITDTDILKHFDMGHTWQMDPDGNLQITERLNSTEGVPPEILFLEKCIQWLKPGGKLGIVMARGVLDGRRTLIARRYLLRTCRLLAVINCHPDTFEPHTGTKASLIIAQKWPEGEQPLVDYPVFMAISKKIGQGSVGKPIFKTDAQGKHILVNGQQVLDHDTDQIAEAYWDAQNNRPLANPFTFQKSISVIQASGNVSLNPVRYLPTYQDSSDEVARIGDAPGWRLERLGAIANAVFNGPRFKRPYADEGVTSGPGIARYFTGTAMTQGMGQNIKYLDYNKASAVQQRQLDELTILKGYILITDSGTLGRVIYATEFHDGAVATNNLIRIVIEDEALRGYVYQFLMSDLGQHQLLKNAYGTIQDHLEPYHVADVLIPVPDDQSVVEAIGLAAVRSVERSEQSHDLIGRSRALFEKVIHDETQPFDNENESEFRVSAEVAQQVQRLLLSPGVADLQSEFNRLKEQWENGRRRGSDVAEMIMHPAYQRIIGMGPNAVPLILSELEKKPGHWFWALHAITGANPVPPDSEGNLMKMALAWLEWGREHEWNV